MMGVRHFRQVKRRQSDARKCIRSERFNTGLTAKLTICQTCNALLRTAESLSTLNVYMMIKTYNIMKKGEKTTRYQGDVRKLTDGGALITGAGLMTANSSEN